MKSMKKENKFHMGIREIKRPDQKTQKVVLQLEHAYYT